MPGFFYLTRYEDVVAVSRDAETYQQTPFRPLDDDDRPGDMRQLGESAVAYLADPGFQRWRILQALRQLVDDDRECACDVLADAGRLLQCPQPRGTRIGARAINLPSGVCLKREQVQYVCEQIRDLL